MGIFIFQRKKLKGMLSFIFNGTQNSLIHCISFGARNGVKFKEYSLFCAAHPIILLVGRIPIYHSLLNEIFQ